MSAITKNTNYSVIRISGESTAGGDPDAIANKIMANWNLEPGDGDPSTLFEDAVPTEQFKLADPEGYAKLTRVAQFLFIRARKA